MVLGVENGVVDVGVEGEEEIVEMCCCGGDGVRSRAFVRF